MMTSHLTLFLAYFLVIFSRFWLEKGGVLKRLPMISGIRETGPGKHNRAPSAHVMLLEHGKNLPCALGISDAP